MAPIKSKKSGKPEGKLEYARADVSQEVKEVRRRYNDLRRKDFADEKKFEDLEKCKPCGAKCLAAAKLRLLVYVEAAAKEPIATHTYFKNDKRAKVGRYVQETAQLLLEGASEFGSLPCALLLMKLMCESLTFCISTRNSSNGGLAFLHQPENYWKDPALDLVEAKESERFFCEQVEGATPQLRIREQLDVLMDLRGQVLQKAQAARDKTLSDLTVEKFRNEISVLLESDIAFAPFWSAMMQDNKQKLKRHKQKKGSGNQEEMGRWERLLERKKVTGSDREKAEAMEAHVQQVVEWVLRQLKSAGPEKALEALQDLFTLSPQEVNEFIKDKQNSELRKLLEHWGTGQASSESVSIEADHNAEQGLLQAFHEINDGQAMEQQAILAQVSTGLSRAYSGSLPQDLSAVKIAGHDRNERADALAAVSSMSRNDAVPPTHPMWGALPETPHTKPDVQDGLARLEYDCVPEEELFDVLEMRIATRAHNLCVDLEDNQSSAKAVLQETAQQQQRAQLQIMRIYRGRGSKVMRLIKLLKSPNSSEEAIKAAMHAMEHSVPCCEPACQSCVSQGLVKGTPASSPSAGDEPALDEDLSVSANGKHVELDLEAKDAGSSWGTGCSDADSDDDPQQLALEDSNRRKDVLHFISSALHTLHGCHLLTRFLVHCLIKFTLKHLQRLLKDERSMPKATTITWEHLTLLDTSALKAITDHLAFTLGIRAEALPVLYNYVDAQCKTLLSAPKVADQRDEIFRTQKGLALRITEDQCRALLKEEALRNGPEEGTTQAPESLAADSAFDSVVLQGAQLYVRWCFGDDTPDKGFGDIPYSDEENLGDAFHATSRIYALQCIQKHIQDLDPIFLPASNVKRHVQDEFEVWLHNFRLEGKFVLGHNFFQQRKLTIAFKDIAAFFQNPEVWQAVEPLLTDDLELLQDLRDVGTHAAELSGWDFMRDVLTRFPGSIYDHEYLHGTVQKFYDTFKQQADCLVDGINALQRKLLHVVDVALDVEVIHARQWLESAKHCLHEQRVGKALMHGIRHKLTVSLKKDQEAESLRRMEALLAEEASTEQQAKGQQSKKKKKGKKAAVPEKEKEEEEEEAAEPAEEEPAQLSPGKEDAARKAAEYAAFEASLKQASHEQAGSRQEDDENGWTEKSSNRNRRRRAAASLGDQAQHSQARRQDRNSGAGPTEERASQAGTEASSSGKSKRKKRGGDGQGPAEEANSWGDAVPSTREPSGTSMRAEAGISQPARVSGEAGMAGGQDGGWDSGRRPRPRAVPQDSVSEDGWVHVQSSSGEKDSWERAAQERETEIQRAKDASAKPQERAQSRDTRPPREDRKAAREIPTDVPRGCFLCRGHHNLVQCSKFLALNEVEKANVKEKFLGPRMRPAPPIGNLAKAEVPRGCLACGSLYGHSYRDCATFANMSFHEKAEVESMKKGRKDCYYCHEAHDVINCPKLKQIPKDPLRRLARAYRVQQQATIRQILNDYGLKINTMSAASTSGRPADLAAASSRPAPVAKLSVLPSPSTSAPSASSLGGVSWASRLKGESTRPPADDRRSGNQRGIEQDAVHGAPLAGSGIRGLQESSEVAQYRKVHPAPAEAPSRSAGSIERVATLAGGALLQEGIAEGTPMPVLKERPPSTWAAQPSRRSGQMEHMHERWGLEEDASIQGLPRSSNDRYTSADLGPEQAQDDLLTQPSWHVAPGGMAEGLPFVEQRPAPSPRHAPGPPGFSSGPPGFGPPPGFTELPVLPSSLPARSQLPRPIKMESKAEDPPAAPEEEEDDAFNDLMGLLVPTSVPPAKLASLEAASSEGSATTGHGRTYMDTLKQRSELESQPSVADRQAAQEEEELERAIQASLLESNRPDYSEVYSGESALQLTDVITPGLANDAGAYNCFLNCVVQCLWQCTALREALQTWGPAQIQGNAVVAGLVELFKAFAAEEAAAEQRGGAGRRQAVTPQALREALAAWGRDSDRFAEGQMHDAAEMLDAVFDNLCCVDEGAALVQRVVQWHVHEYVDCSVCQHTSHQLEYRQYYYTTFATALREEMAIDLGDDDYCETPSLGSLLSRVQCQHEKSCDTDTGGCSRMNIVTHGLMSRPRQVFMLQLGWERAHESSQDIADTLATIQESLDVAEVFSGSKKKGFYMYALRSMVAYYGSHYHAFVRNPDTKLWRIFDDTHVSEVGGWQDVLRKCHLGKIQPSVLFYEACS